MKAIEVFKDNFKNRIHQVLEFIDGKEIFDELAEHGAFDESLARSVYKQILEGLNYLHENGVCHRDIKPSNILVTKDCLDVYLADFNVAAKKSADQESFKMYTKTAGTLAFAAPERLKEN